MSQYIFPGLWPFIERAACGRDVPHLGRARDNWHGKQIQDALGQVPRLDPASRQELLGHVLKIRESLGVAIEGIDLAIAEVGRELDLFDAEYEPPNALTAVAPKPKKRTASSV